LDGDYDLLRGGAGDDTVDGGAGTGDLASFSTSLGGVTAELTSGSASGDGTDDLTGIEALEGSPFDDHLTGNNADNHFAGLAGNDTLEGGGGFDTAYFQFATSPVTIDLAGGSATGDGSDSLSDIEGALGSALADHLGGDGEDNVLAGMLGDDQIQGSSGNDLLDGNDGSDSLDGGEGTDGCLAGESLTGCESAHPLGDEYAAVVAFAAVQPGGKIVEEKVAEIQGVLGQRSFQRSFRP
jgi:Ca2+-binding RTX toxin-like protein